MWFEFVMYGNSGSWDTFHLALYCNLRTLLRWLVSSSWHDSFDMTRIFDVWHEMHATRHLALYHNLGRVGRSADYRDDSSLELWHDSSDMARVRDIRHEIFRETLLHIHLYSPICVEPQIIEANLLKFWSWYDSSAWLNRVWQFPKKRRFL